MVDEIKQDDQFEQMAIEDLVYGNHHALNLLLDLLIEKGVISEQEFKDKLDAVIDESENVEDVKIDVPSED
jgi:hypothetical protein